MDAGRPRWVLALVMGIPFGLSQALATRFGQDTSWTYALAWGAIAGLFSAAILGVVARRKNRQVREAVGQLPETQLEQATRAGWRGPVRRTPRRGEAAHRLLVSQLGQARRQRVWVVLLGTHVYLLRHFRRRVELLAAAPHRESAGT